MYPLPTNSSATGTHYARRSGVSRGNARAALRLLGAAEVGAEAEARVGAEAAGEDGAGAAHRETYAERRSRYKADCCYGPSMCLRWTLHNYGVKSGCKTVRQ